MQAFISKVIGTVAKRILRLTLYDMMQASHDFEDVKAALDDRTDWSIQLFRSCFTIMTIHLRHDISFFMLTTLSFLVMAENIHIHYGRLSPGELKERAENIGHATFAIFFVVLDVGCVIVRIAGVIAMCESPLLAGALILVSMSPPVVVPALAYLVSIFERRRNESTRDAEKGTGQ